MQFIPASKTHGTARQTILLATVILFLCHAGSQAQTPTSLARISITNKSEIGVEIRLATPADSWSFRNVIAGALGLGERVQQFRASQSGQELAVKAIAAGEFRCDAPADTVRYQVRIPPGNPADLAHVSWLSADAGLLLLADLLPEAISSASLTFELPTGWSAQSSSVTDQTGSFQVNQAEQAVFFVGPKARVSSKTVQGMNLQVVVSSDLEYTGQSVVKAANKVLERYFDLTRFALREKPTILLLPLPVSDAGTQWKAETRGSTVVLLVNPRAEITNWPGQLGIIFTHEIFHLWVPNSLTLRGDYDWFFEGFTLYVALRAALRLKLIRFQEFLDTLARVYDSYHSYEDNQTLIEAAERRWTSSDPVVYDKGMLVAFIYDLMIRRDSEGRSSLEDRYRTLFAMYANEPANANDVIIKLLDSPPATKDFSTSYIESTTRIELERILPSFGMAISRDAKVSHLNVSKDLTGEQRQLLRSLGYRK